MNFCERKKMYYLKISKKAQNNYYNLLFRTTIIIIIMPNILSAVYLKKNVKRTYILVFIHL